MHHPNPSAHLLSVVWWHSVSLFCNHHPSPELFVPSELKLCSQKVTHHFLSLKYLIIFNIVILCLSREKKKKNAAQCWETPPQRPYISVPPFPPLWALSRQRLSSVRSALDSVSLPGFINIH